MRDCLWPTKVLPSQYDSANYTTRHECFLFWVQTYPSLTCSHPYNHETYNNSNMSPRTLVKAGLLKFSWGWCRREADKRRQPCCYREQTHWHRCCSPPAAQRRPACQALTAVVTQYNHTWRKIYEMLTWLNCPCAAAMQPLCLITQTSCYYCVLNVVWYMMASPGRQGDLCTSAAWHQSLIGSIDYFRQRFCLVVVAVVVLIFFIVCCVANRSD